MSPYSKGMTFDEAMEELQRASASQLDPELVSAQAPGHSFDKNAFRKSRQVVELKPNQIEGGSPEDRIYPLIEPRPGSARLVFPEERFRNMDRMEFVNADFNRVAESQRREFHGL